MENPFVIAIYMLCILQPIYQNSFIYKQRDVSVAKEILRRAFFILAADD